MAVQWIAFAYLPRSWFGSGKGGGITAAIVAVILVALLVSGLPIWRRTNLALTISYLILIANSMLFIYSGFYYYLGSAIHPVNFTSHLSRTNALEIALGNLTNANIDAPKPVTQGAKELILSQSVCDLVFIGVFLAIGVAAITEWARSQPRTT